MIEQAKNYTTRRGDKFWYLPSKGKDYWHRLDGPTLEYKDGTKEWWVDDKRHRLDGPAVEDANGSKHWFVDGKRHRLDGPAIEYGNKSKQWWVKGERLSTEEVEEWLEENDVDLKTESGQMAFKLRWS